jgi:hypothetical protein
MLFLRKINGVQIYIRMFKRCVDYIRSWKQGFSGGDGVVTEQVPNPGPSQPVAAVPPPISQEPLLDNTPVSEQDPTGNFEEGQPVVAVPPPISQEPLLDNTPVSEQNHTGNFVEEEEEQPQDPTGNLEEEGEEQPQDPTGNLEEEEEQPQDPTGNLGEEGEEEPQDHTGNLEEEGEEQPQDPTGNFEEEEPQEPTGNLGEQDISENLDNPLPPEPLFDIPPPIVPIFIENPDDIFDKSTYTFLNSEILEYTVFFSIYKIVQGGTTHPPFLQYLSATVDNSLTFPKMTFKNADYPPNENVDDNPIDGEFTDAITKYLLDITKAQIPDFSEIYKGVIPMSMDTKINTILFVFVDFSEIAFDGGSSPLKWRLPTDLMGYYIGLELQAPAFEIDENIKILFNEHYEISVLKSLNDEGRSVVIKPPITVFLCNYDVGTREWSNRGILEGGQGDGIPRQDHPFGYYPFVSSNLIGKTNVSEMDGSEIKKYYFFVETIQKTLYILPTVEGGSAPGEIDLYDGSVFKTICLEDNSPFDSPEISEPFGDEGEGEGVDADDVLEPKKYSAIYFVDQGNILWCIKNTDLLMDA